MELRRILIVDDDATTLKVLSVVLRGEGFVVDACDSIERALSHLRGAAEYDILLTDLVLPTMSGGELIEQARALKPSIRCILMSGHRRTESPLANAVPQDVEWITKPLEIDVLLAALDRTKDLPA